MPIAREPSRFRVSEDGWLQGPKFEELLERNQAWLRPFFRPKFGGVFWTPSFFSWMNVGYPLVNIRKNYGISPFLLAKSTISMAIFNGYVRPWRRFQTLHRHRSMLLGHGHCSRWFLYVFFFLNVVFELKHGFQPILYGFRIDKHPDP